MGAPLVGDVVIIPFPYFDLSQSKRRPALVLAEAGRGDFLLCQITSKQYGDLHAMSIKESDSWSCWTSDSFQAFRSHLPTY
jgi:mRNA interferase MazF